MGKLASTVEDRSRSVAVDEEGGKAEEAAAAAAAAAARAAKRQRLKSGFRICKPQGTFLWPNMGGSATGSCRSSNNSNSTSSNMVVSPPPHHHNHHQVVEDLPMVPTPPSVSSSSKPSHPQLPPPHLLPHPTSPVKPLAEKRAVKVHVLPESACLADSTFPVSHHPHVPNAQRLFSAALVLPTHHPTVAARAERLEAMGSSSSTTVMTTGTWKQKVQEKDTYGSDTWLALATPSPSS